jgi:hypothetical protein
MFTCFLGKGDKETFAYAFMAVGEPYTMIKTPPRAIGTTGTPPSAALLTRCGFQYACIGTMQSHSRLHGLCWPAAVLRPIMCPYLQH